MQGEEVVQGDVGDQEVIVDLLGQVFVDYWNCVEQGNDYLGVLVGYLILRQQVVYEGFGYQCQVDQYVEDLYQFVWFLIGVVEQVVEYVQVDYDEEC